MASAVIDLAAKCSFDGNFSQLVSSNLSTQCLQQIGESSFHLPEFGILAMAGSVVERFFLVIWTLAASSALIVWITRTIPLILRGEVKFKKLEPSVWTIHGKKYDLSSWAKDHPGGETAINLGRNRDCTALFESYHLMSNQDKIWKTLSRFEIEDSTSKENNSAGNSTGLQLAADPFLEDVRLLLKDHFKEQSCKTPAFAGTVLLLQVLLQIYLLYRFTFGCTVAMFLLAFNGWILTSNVAHDGSHFAVSKYPILNELAARCALPCYFPAWGWRLQHVVQHHVFTNQQEDVDLFHFLPLVRTTRVTEWVSSFKMQWLTIFALIPTSVGHLMFIVPADLLTGQTDMITGEKRYHQSENLEDFVARHWTSIFMEFLFCLSFWGVSIYIQGFLEGARRVVIVLSLSSFFFMVVTQGAHLQHDCMFDDDRYKSWALRQAATSLNFYPESRFWTYLCGGLNAQSLHHVVPGVANAHYPDLYPKYKALCAKHGHQIKEAEGFLDFCSGFIGWISELAKEDSLKAVSSEDASSKVKQS